MADWGKREEGDGPGPGPEGGTRAPSLPLAATQPGSGELPAAEPESRQPAKGPWLSVPEASGLEADRYELVKLLGEGAMGSVYLAHDRRLDRCVALKFIRGGEPRLSSRLQQEARVQARIDHPNICKVFEAGVFQGKPYIAMQYIPGCSLEQARAEMSLAEKVLVIRDVAFAIHEAHRLGVIHRDLKPSNILVSRNEDGRYVPVVMDFGLARANDRYQGLTESGAVMGTPSFMSPEQARGDIKDLDRRTDVYALGATLYTLLAGRAPITGESVAAVLLAVLSTEPTPLRSINPAIPVDLETIAMKCLRKEPGQRYDSARALGEDLQRYINGDSILGKRTTLWQRLRQRARRNKGAVGVGAASLLCLCVLGLYLAQARLAVQRERTQSSVRAKLAQELGQDIKEMEWFLRSVRQLPPHETGYARRLVRARIDKLAASGQGLDEAGQGLVQYALGQGYLALQEFDKAAEHLTSAQRKGNDTPDLRLALGQVLGEQYARKLADALRSGDARLITQRRKQLAEELLKPAAAALRGSQGARPGAPLFLEGLIHLYSNRYEDSLRKAEAALQQAPWLYEARKLMGDAHFARAVERITETDYEAAQAGFERAVSQYREASEVGRSDTALYDALAESYLQLAEIAINRYSRHSDTTLLENVVRYCEVSIKLDPERADCYSKQARAYAIWVRAAYLLGQNPKVQVDKLIDVATRALRFNPDDASSYDSLGMGYHTLAGVKEGQGREAVPEYDKAIEYYRTALSKQQTHPVSLTNMGLVHLEKALHVWSRRGVVSQDDLDRAAQFFEQATKVDPKYPNSCINHISLYRYLVQFAVLRGSDPTELVRRAWRVIRPCAASNKDPDLRALPAFMDAYFVDYLLPSGDTAHIAELLQQHRALLDGVGSAAAPTPISAAGIGILARDEARLLLLKGEDPLAALARAQDAVRVCLSFDSLRYLCHKLASEIALTRADWALRQRRPVLPHLQEAVAAARLAVADDAGALIDEAHLQLARSLLRRLEAEPVRASLAEIEQGLASTARTLSMSVGYAEAVALRGGFLLLKARLASRAPERQSLTAEARSAFDRAVQMNPRLGAEYRDHIRRASAAPR